MSDPKHDNARQSGKPVWRPFEAASATGIAGSILRVEVTPDDPSGASWLLSVYNDGQGTVLTSGAADTVDEAKHEAWTALRARRGDDIH